MELYTIQIAQWREAKARGVTFIDTTVKSGHKELAPTWEMVYLSKNSTDENREANHRVYTDLYKAIVVRSYKTNPDFWHSLLANDKLAIGCYCKEGVFCHRHILKDFIAFLCKGLKIPFVYLGELKKEVPCKKLTSSK